MSPFGNLCRLPEQAEDHNEVYFRNFSYTRAKLATVSFVDLMKSKYAKMEG